MIFRSVVITGRDRDTGEFYWKVHTVDICDYPAWITLRSSLRFFYYNLEMWVF